MAVRSSMAALIARTRLLINDPSGASQVFADQDIQDVLDESRQDIYNMAMTPQVTFSSSTTTYQDYLTELGGWEDDLVIKQYLANVVTPSISEPIAGHFHFAVTTLPPLFISGKLHDLYRGAADLLERWAAKVALAYDFSSDGQSFKRSQQQAQLQQLAATYRKKQRVGIIQLTRTDLSGGTKTDGTLAPREIDYYATG